jgi:hypothetical protein
MCEGCENNKGGCIRYLYPELQHKRIGGCAMDTRKVKEVKPEFKLNPMKASKRSLGK